MYSSPKLGTDPARETYCVIFQYILWREKIKKYFNCHTPQLEPYRIINISVRIVIPRTISDVQDVRGQTIKKPYF